MRDVWYICCIDRHDKNKRPDSKNLFGTSFILSYRRHVLLITQKKNHAPDMSFITDIIILFLNCTYVILLHSPSEYSRNKIVSTSFPSFYHAILKTCRKTYFHFCYICVAFPTTRSCHESKKENQKQHTTYAKRKTVRTFGIIYAEA